MELITNGKSAETIANQINKIITNSTANPTVTDDETQNFFIGSKWINTETGQEFTCQDATTGAAVWILAVPDIATQSEAETGTDNKKSMSPLRVFQAIAKWISSISIGSIGSFNNSSITSDDTVVSSLGKLQGQINNKQKSITYGTGTPSGGSNGDVYDQYFN